MYLDAARRNTELVCYVDSTTNGKSLLTVKVKHADVVAVDKPFLVSCNGPSFKITYL